jgi:hypothetical protein
MSGKMALLVQCCVAICCFVLVVQGEKRLLLSDPDVVNDRLLQMEKEIQKLTADTANKLASFTAEVASHKQQITSKIAMSYLNYLYLFAHSGVQHILCGVFVLLRSIKYILASTERLTELASHKQQITSKIAKLEQSSSGKFVCIMFLRYCPSTTQEESVTRRYQALVNLSVDAKIYLIERNKTKTPHNMCWTPLCANKYK